MSSHALNLPPGYSRIKVVSSFEELATTRMENGINALCWQRALDGNFDEVVAQLSSSEDIADLDEDVLQSLRLSPGGKRAVGHMIEDVARLRDLSLSPTLNCISRYPRDDDGEVVPTDVYSFHADSATAEADTWLCSYTEAASEGLRNEDALRCIDIPEVRATLLSKYGGPDDSGFREYLRESCYDLHYIPVPGAKPFSFGFFNLWRIAVEYPDSPVPPCVHRAPETVAGRPPRLLLIS